MRKSRHQIFTLAAVLNLGTAVDAGAATVRVAVLEPHSINAELPPFNCSGALGTGACRVARLIHCESASVQALGNVGNCQDLNKTQGSAWRDPNVDHAQKVSGVVASRSNASRVDIIHISYAGRNGKLSDRGAALNWILANHADSNVRIGVLNESGGSNGGELPEEICTTPQNDPKLESLAAAGVTVVKSAGNFADQVFNSDAKPGYLLSVGNINTDLALDGGCETVGGSFSGGECRTPLTLTGSSWSKYLDFVADGASTSYSAPVVAASVAEAKALDPSGTTTLAGVRSTLYRTNNFPSNHVGQRSSCDLLEGNAQGNCMQDGDGNLMPNAPLGYVFLRVSPEMTADNIGSPNLPDPSGTGAGVHLGEPAATCAGNTGQVSAPTLSESTGVGWSTDGQYSLYWSHEGAGLKYFLERQSWNTGNWNQRYSGTALSFHESVVHNGVRMYRVKACTLAAPTTCSDWSNIVTVETELGQ